MTVVDGLYTHLVSRVALNEVAQCGLVAMLQSQTSTAAFQSRNVG